MNWLRNKFHRKGNANAYTDELKSTDNNIKQEDDKELELHLEKLIPKKCSEKEMKYYKESLDYIFSQSDLLNIAVSGDYGAGKSSVIQTYDDLYENKKFIYISLAHFEQEQLENNDIIKTEVDSELDLEGKIINQLIHQIKVKKIPLTRFKIKNDISKISLIIHAALINILFISIFYLFNFGKWKEIVHNTWFTITTTRVAHNAFFIVAIVGSTFYIYKIIRSQYQKHIFKRIKFNGSTEIELFEKNEKNDESYFDKYLDEILYLFLNANADAIVFEDIDRYRNNLIFSKLREINNLINKKTNKPIRFLYLVRDNIFSSKDRTKFFDIILPIIPVIDSSNSYDQLLKHFNNSGIKFDELFLDRVSLYIDDMRVLKNIHNEFVIYYGKIKGKEQGLDKNKLLALIIYKNIFPKDFSELQLNYGFVYNIFANKKQYNANEKNKLLNKIKQNIKDIEDIKNENLNDLIELDTLYFKSNEWNYINSVRYKTRKEFIEAVWSEDQDHIKKRFSGNEKYEQRREIINGKNKNRIKELENTNDKLYSKINLYNSLKMRDIINKDNINEIFNLDNKKENNNYDYIIKSLYYPLIKYLIRNGYIDETYKDYLTYFYAESLSTNDKIFLRSITDEIAVPFDYSLTHVDKIVSKLRVLDFGHEEVLNFKLLNYLLENNHKYLDNLLVNIKGNKRFDFVWSYLHLKKKNNKKITELKIENFYLDKFVLKLNKIWKEIGNYLFSDSVSEITKMQKNLYMMYTLLYSDGEDLCNMNIDYCITRYISNVPDFLATDLLMDYEEENILQTYFASAIKAFINLDISFKNIDYELANKDFFREIYNNNLYDLNYEMTELILNNVYQVDLNTANGRLYTIILSKPDEPFKGYVDNNLKSYIKVILDNSQDDINDDEDCVIKILNSNADIEDKINYIKKLTTLVSYLDVIEEKDLWKVLIDKNVKQKKENILLYYGYYSIDNSLINYINGFTNNFKMVDDDFSEYQIDKHKFYEDVMNCNELDNQKYKMILNSYYEQIFELCLNDKVDEDKIKVLIDLEIIAMSKDNINYMREEYPELMTYFVSNNTLDYIEKLDDDILVKDEILMFLEEASISDENKIKLIEEYPDRLEIKDKNYSEKMLLYIIENNKLDFSDFEIIINRYETSTITMKHAIENLCVKNTNKVMDINIDNLIPLELIYNIMLSNEYDEKYKKRMIIESISELNIKQVRQCFVNAKLTKFVKVFEGKRPMVRITPENKNILSQYKKRGWISSYNPDKGNSNYYRVQGRKIKDNKDDDVAVELL
ncbi:hypothetical protein SH1V18_18030 [Vallitalea longa]|uniref:YobI-like P-loop NTPase domain-containing protein n=1 Tax=Vallitalea longa TaxID=2936439 RepID=A0A9W5YDP3_9FIRM|nr:hypothetical protein [Vallitalea longa]GKX29323.1 hypothetical protein SH1V18_18030 [Vallitalea longa]